LFVVPSAVRRTAFVVPPSGGLIFVFVPLLDSELSEAGKIEDDEDESD